MSDLAEGCLIVLIGTAAGTAAGLLFFLLMVWVAR